MTNSGIKKVLIEAQPDADSEAVLQATANLNELLQGYNLRQWILFKHNDIVFRVAHLEPDISIQVDDETEIEISFGREEEFANLKEVQTLEDLLEEQSEN
jgi:hypothetical protein